MDHFTCHETQTVHGHRIDGLSVEGHTFLHSAAQTLLLGMDGGSFKQPQTDIPEPFHASLKAKRPGQTAGWSRHALSLAEKIAVEPLEAILSLFVRGAEEL